MSRAKIYLEMTIEAQRKLTCDQLTKVEEAMRILSTISYTTTVAEDWITMSKMWSFDFEKPEPISNLPQLAELGSDLKK